MRKTIIVLLSVLLNIAGSIASAYDPESHREIGHRAADPDVSTLDQFLKDELSMQGGIRETFAGLSISGPRTVRQLIGDGAFFEDVPDTRSLNHFHNPLVETWDQSGLRILGVQVGQSSALWQQNPGQGALAGGGNWSWQDARRHYLEALTGETRSARDQAFAETFEALGACPRNGV